MPQFSDSFFDDLSPSAVCDSSSTGEVFEIAEEHSGDSVDWFFRNVNGYYKSNLKIGHLNINSLQNKLDEVKNILNKCLFDIFFISETKLDGTTSDSFLQQPGYRTIRRDRKKGAGGLIAFVREDIPVCRRRNLEPESVESLCLDVMDSKKARFIVCACYRSPKFCKITDFLSSLTSAIELMYTSRQEILLIGDFNIDLLVGEHGVVAEDNSLMDLCDRFCLQNQISEPTRVTEKTKSLLDVILASHPERYATCGNLHMGLSDHDLIYAVRKNKLPRAKAREIEYRNMRQFDLEKFLNDLKTVPWSSAYIYDDVDDLWHHWAQLYTEVLDKHAPIKKKRVRGDQLPWITPLIQREISRRNRLFKKHAKSPTTTSWEEFKKQRNKVTSLKRKGLKAFCMEASSNTKHHGEFWNKLRPLLPSKEKKQSKIILIENERVITDSLMVAEMFNNYFCEVSRSDGDSKEMVEFVDHPSVKVIAEKTCDDVFDLVPVDVGYIRKILDSLDPRKAVGCDKISQRLLRLSSPVIAEPVTRLINYFITNRQWPIVWKSSDVVPVFKKESMTDKTCYRPVSVLTSLSKLYEKVLFDQIYEAFHWRLSPNLSGFLKGHSCCTALLKLTEDWRACLDRREAVAAVAIDLSKAFDSVCHPLLLAKLKAYGFTHDALETMTAYLTGRRQRVKLDGVYSSWRTVKTGVPQGSLLGPLLFNLYVNDLNYFITSTSLRLYADDTTHYASDVSPTVLQYIINSDLSVLSRWFSMNFLQINAAKTQAIAIGPSSYQYDFHLNDSNVHTKDTLKILGVVLDSKLTFKAHIKQQLNKGCAKASALRRIRKFISKDVLVRLYKAYVLPHLEYCSPLLLGVGNAETTKIETTNYFILRTILGFSKSVSYDFLLKLADIKSLENRRQFQSLVMLYKCLYDKGAPYISDFFHFRNVPYSLRGLSTRLDLPPFNLEFLHRSFSFLASKLWNALPPRLRESQDIASFKRSLKAHMA